MLCQTNRLNRTRLLASIAILALLPSLVQATTLVAGGVYVSQLHENENHSNQTLDGIDISFGSFANTNLKNSSLIGGVFVNTNFTDANLQGVDLSGANLTGATFNANVNLKNADLTGANLVGIDLTGINITGVDFTGAFYDGTSNLGFDPAAAGMVAVPELSPLMMCFLGFVLLAANRPRALAAGGTA